jgi:hypothetical protein
MTNNPKLRADLPPLPSRMAALPVDLRGYPVPFFVSWINGEQEFRVADARKFKLCQLQKLCWVCGQRLRGLKTFVIGPMCVVNRNTAEPPSHLECAEFSARACPFLTKPQMVRREDEFTESLPDSSAGISIKRNPGVTCLWTTLTYKAYRDFGQRTLFRVGEPEAVSWWCKGRPATRAEVVESIESGLPLLRSLCQCPEDVRLLADSHAAALRFLPSL